MCLGRKRDEMLYSLRFQARDLSVQFCTTAMSRGERWGGSKNEVAGERKSGRERERGKRRREK